jgi:hypothetical protein
MRLLHIMGTRGRDVILQASPLSRTDNAEGIRDDDAAGSAAHSKPSPNRNLEDRTTTTNHIIAIFLAITQTIKPSRLNDAVSVSRQHRVSRVAAQMCAALRLGGSAV